MDLNRIRKVIRQPRYLSWALKIQMTKLSKSVFHSHHDGAQRDQERIIMFHIGRSGSTVLADMLNRHRNIMWSGEIAKTIAGDRTTSPQEKRSALEKAVGDALGKYSVYSVYGFEIKPFHIRKLGFTVADFVEWAQARGFTKYIILERKNYLKKILSSISAKRSGKWHAPADVKPVVEKTHLPIESVPIDQNQLSLIELLNGYSADFEEIRAALRSVETLELTYEADIQQDPRLAAERCYEFSNVDVARVKARYGRTNPYSVRESIDNPQDIRAALEGSRYAWMLDD